MRKLLVSTFVLLAWMVPVLAQDAPHDQRSVLNAAQDQDVDVPPNQTAQSFQQSLQTQLAQAGFTDIQMTPTSFLVRAKDPDGNSVMLMLSPNSITELPVPGQGLQDDDSGSATPSDQPSTRSPGADDAE